MAAAALIILRKASRSSRIMTAGSGQGQNQNYQVNQIDSNFFLTTMVPPSSAVPPPTTSTIGITVDESKMLTAQPPAMTTSTATTVVTEATTTTSQSTPLTDSPTVTDQITPEIQDETTATVTQLIIGSYSQTYYFHCVFYISYNKYSCSFCKSRSNLNHVLASTTSTSTTGAINTPSTVQVTEHTAKTDTLESSSTESDIIVFPDEDTTSDKQVTFPPLIYQLMSWVNYTVPGFVFPSEIKIYLNFPNSTFIVPAIIQANTDTQVNETTVNQAPNNDSIDNTSSKEEVTENSNHKTTSSTDAPIRDTRNDDESASGKKAPKRDREAPTIQTPSNEAPGKQVPEKEIRISETTLSTTQITPSTLALDKEADSTQTQSTELDTGILVVLTSSIETTSTKTDPIVNINDFINDFEENIDLSDNTPNSDFGQITDHQAVGQTSIHKIKCDEYSNFPQNSNKRITREKNNLPFQLFIVGGVQSGEKEFPHMAALGYGNGEEKQWLCGGSLISEKFILTAAHCLSSKELGDVQVIRLGTTTLQTETLESMDYRVLRKIPHPLYATGQQYNDIALIELDGTVKFTEYILPICLDDGNGYSGIKLIATGWGRLQATGSVSKELQKVDLDYFPQDICQEKYSKGDSGGPLQEKIFGRNYLVGITSFGIGCGTPGIPGVYTKVSHYIPWIESVITFSEKQIKAANHCKYLCNLNIIDVHQMLILVFYADIIYSSSAHLYFYLKLW
nr:unnamed protein product [Callosobruchus analis]